MNRCPDTGYPDILSYFLTMTDWNSNAPWAAFNVLYPTTDQSLEESARYLSCAVKCGIVFW